MRERERVQRALLRRALRKHLRRAATHESKLIQLTLDDEAVFETVYETAMQNAGQFGETTGAFTITHDRIHGHIVDNLLKLLQWFISNGPQLIEIIRIIVELFGGLRVTTDLCEAETFYVE